MRPSNRAIGIVLLGISLFFRCDGMLWAQSAQNPASDKPRQQQPVRDLTPLSDAEIESKNAAEAQPVTTEAPPAPGSDARTAGRKTADDKYTFRADVEEVLLYATVVDDKNHQITDLDKSVFTVYEDGQRQPITSFRRDDVPVSLGILIDNSASMREERPAVNQAALNLVRASNPQDEVFVVNFSDESYLDQDFTADLRLLREALEKVEARGGTKMFDTVIAASNHLAKGGKLDKKVLLVITDGEDNLSQETLETTVSKAQETAGPMIYAIGILGNDRGAKRAKRALQRLAVETGGMAFFPKDLSEVDAISREVARDIRNQFTIGYKPLRPQSEGGFRAVRVEAADKRRGKLQVRTRSGYFAGQRPETATRPQSVKRQAGNPQNP